jgi:hypothetical protein
MTQPAKASAALTQAHPAALEVFRDAYMKFRPAGRARRGRPAPGLLGRLKDFLVELGRDFCFVGSHYPLQVGGRDFALDLLFFHRGLNCLVAIELKVGRSSPSTWASWISISKPSTATNAKPTRTRHRRAAVRQQGR